VSVVNIGLENIASALIELRDDEHWRDTGHTSFHEFCKDNFKLSKSYLYDIIKGLENISKLPKEIRPKITNGAQALALSKIPEKSWVKAILEAEKNGGVTAENLLLRGAKNITPKKPQTKSGVSVIPDTSVSESQPVTTENKKTTPPQQSKKIELDCIQTPIPDEALAYWKMRDKVQGILTQISDAKKAFKDAAKGDHPLYIRVYQNALDYLSRAYHVVSDCKPYTICTRCMGSPSLQPEGCSFCASTGVISRLRWKNNADPRVKQMRMLSNADYAKSHNLPAPSEQPEELEEV
jgi:hypothetical protein